MPNIKFIGFLISVFLERDYDYSWAMGGQNHERDVHKALFPPKKLKKIMNRKNYALVRHFHVKVEKLLKKPITISQKIRYKIMNSLIHFHKNCSPEIHMIFQKTDSYFPTKEKTDKDLEASFYF